MGEKSAEDYVKNVFPGRKVLHPDSYQTEGKKTFWNHPRDQEDTRSTEKALSEKGPFLLTWIRFRGVSTMGKTGPGGHWVGKKHSINGGPERTDGGFGE